MTETPTDQQVLNAARRYLQSDGLTEFDDDAKVSRADDNPERGAYIQAWLWIDDASATSQ